jgi:hypothetical protein
MDKINTSHISGKHVFLCQLIIIVISLVLQYDMYFGFPHIPPIILSILGVQAPNPDAHPPKVLLHICYPTFSWSSFYRATKFFIQDICGHTVRPPTTPSRFDRSDIVSVAKDGLDF